MGLYYNELDSNWCLIKCLEMTFVVIWCHINKMKLYWRTLYLRNRNKIQKKQNSVC